MIVAGLYENLHIHSAPLTQLTTGPTKQLTTENLKSDGIDLNTAFDQLIKPSPARKYKKSVSNFARIKFGLNNWMSSVIRHTRSSVAPNYFRIIQLNPKKMAMFRLFSFILIIINDIVLCIDNSNLSHLSQKWLIQMDFALLFLFYIEIVIRLVNQKRFFSKFLNIFDFCLLAMNIAMQIYLLITNCNYLQNNCQSKIYVIIRSLHVLRIFRILVSSYWKNISVLIIECLKIFWKMTDLWVTAIIFFTIFSLIGRDLFSFSKATHGIQEEELQRINFNGFFNAFFSNFLIFTAEEWHISMLIHLRTFKNVTVIIFFTTNLLICTVFFNKIFLATLINNLMESTKIKQLIDGRFNPFKKIRWILKQFILKISVLKLFIGKFKQEKINLMFQSQKNKSKKWKETLKKFKNHRIFVFCMFMSVIFSLVILAMHDPYQSKNSKFNKIWYYLDMVIFIVFAIELFFEWILRENGYFTTNILIQTSTCFIYLIYFTYENYLVKLFLVLRLFLLIGFSKKLKLTFKALMKSILDILQLFFFFLLITLVFAVIGVKCFKGAFWYCEGLETEFLEQIQMKNDCFDFGGDWVNRDFNFDNILKALEMMFFVSNSEGWLSLM